jgi:hypothetical protein
VRTTTLNQNGEVVHVIIANLVVPRRPKQDGREAKHESIGGPDRTAARQPS